MLTRILENNVRLGFDIPETKFGEMIRLHEYDETQSTGEARVRLYHTVK